ncbi:MAG TPA: ABC transporter ATP-binding protein, partial [Blastocatellia bacterium]|nr:ABC transporter ATP-binding protein [Blastocatellia bacterium]
PADGGTVHLGGECADRLPPQARRIGVVFQEHALFQHMTVEQNIAFGLRVRKADARSIRKTVDEMLELVRLGGHRANYPRQLSGGQRQRVALARALAYKPDAMLLDEPFGALDAVTRVELRREVREIIRSLSIPALLITHDQEEALEMADRIAVLNAGRIEQAATPFEIYNHPRNEFVTTFLGAANVLLGRWREGMVKLGALSLKPPQDAPPLRERQAVKVVFRPEDVVLNFQPQLLHTPFYLGRAVIETVTYSGPVERLVARLALWPAQAGGEGAAAPGPQLVDETYLEGFPILITRTKWEASDMELEPGDPVAIGLKGYRLLPHYPLGTESGAKVVD